MRAVLDGLARLATRAAFAYAWWELRFADTNQLRAGALQAHSAGTVRKMLRALRGVLQTCKQLGLIDPYDYA